MEAYTQTFHMIAIRVTIKQYLQMQLTPNLLISTLMIGVPNKCIPLSGLPSVPYVFIKHNLLKRPRLSLD